MPAEHTPMMRQWHEIKHAFPDALLFFRLGDFFELFYDDAETGARELEITLTGRDAGREGRVPMCGVPQQAVGQHVARLVGRGYKVAICEQVEDPKAAVGLVERRVVRLVTPGSRLEDDLLDARRNVYVAALAPSRGRRGDWGLALADVSTGELICAPVDDDPWEAVAQWDAAELLLPPQLAEAPDAIEHARVLGLSLTAWPAARFDPQTASALLCRHFGTATLGGFGVDDESAPAAAAGALLAYVAHTLQSEPTQVTTLRLWRPRQGLALDPATRANLEITQRLDGSHRGSLLWAIDETTTAMGGRLLRAWLAHPLAVAGELEARLDCVAALRRDDVARAATRQALRGVADVERLTARCAAGRATPRDLAALRASLDLVPRLLEEAEGAWRVGTLAAHAADAVPPASLLQQLHAMLAEDPPASVADGGVIRSGFSPELDELRRLQHDSRDLLADVERRERERTGIRSLKVGFNRVFGYYLEVTHVHREAVPGDYIRKQTLANAERYVTEELKTLEERLLHAQEQALALEARLFRELCGEVAAHTGALQRLAAAVAALDVLAGLAEVAARRGYVRPDFTDAAVMDVEALRHPVVEALSGAGEYVPNDLKMDEQARFLLLTGPNMAGKSTYGRAAALCMLLAQIGSFVPASRARLGLADAIFTRVGAGDDLAAGESTFMREMVETSRILRGATARSLVVVDEIGRGTSTYDGLAIAWAVAEELANCVQARTIFTTHYQELTALEGRVPGVRNLSMAVAERPDSGEVVFLHVVRPGAADRSYGIHVAAMAGVRERVLERARELLAQLEREDARPQTAATQISLLPAGPPQRRPHPLEDALDDLDVDALTPRAALDLLYDWQSRYGKGKTK